MSMNGENGERGSVGEREKISGYVDRGIVTYIKDSAWQSVHILVCPLVPLSYRHGE